MNSIGHLLRKKREELDMPLEQIEFETKIPLKKLSLIEENKFSGIDHHFYNKAYIKLYAEVVKLNPDHLIAIYKRDFENIEHKRIGKREEKFRLRKEIGYKLKVYYEKFGTKRNISIVGALVLLTIFGIFAYNTSKTAFRDPYLKIEAPVELNGDYEGRIEYTGSSVVFKGKTEEGVLIEINSEPVTITPGFEFESDLIPVSGDTIVNIKASNQLGRSAEMKITLTKSETTIREMILIVKPTEANLQLQIKADGIVRFDDRTKLEDSIRIVAERTLEINSAAPRSLDVFINDENYILNEFIETFQNDGSKVTQL